MEKIMAVVDQSGKVVNIIIANENTPTEPNTTLVEILSHQFCNVGFTWDGVNFLDRFGNPVFNEDYTN